MIFGSLVMFAAASSIEEVRAINSFLLIITHGRIVSNVGSRVSPRGGVQVAAEWHCLT